MSSNVAVGAVFVFATAVANVLQKKALLAMGPIGDWSADVVRRLLSSPALWGGMCAYAVALVAYWVLLSRVPLNVATSVAALNFVAVLLASRLVLGEPIPPLRFVGFGCILLGLVIVSRTQA